MTASLQEMVNLAEQRYDYLRELLENTDEDVINTRVFENKRCIAEIMVHIFRGDSAPLWFKRIFYTLVNFFNKAVDTANTQPVDASAYTWETHPTSPKIVNSKTLSELQDYLDYSYPRLMNTYDKAKDQHLHILHYTELHSNTHLKQIKIIREHLTDL